MDFETLVARELVRDRYARYNRAGDKGRLDDLAACFTEDGELEARNSFTAKGRQNIIDTLTAVSAELLAQTTAHAAGDRPIVRHFVASLRFDSITPDHIESSAYFAVFHADAADHWGTYRDVLVPAGDVWLFERRLVVIEGTRPGSSAASAKA
ncbi:nuclear transport factor 2 family protein [Rhodococcoides yunnanense]|uniref:Nuclear transport factor 2 family protein n=1 Tax=Rhodococcoides yunnanense TaxID=278209 RepID=A0ABU4BL82_9NOCA|nr:nuclear transport factor 2 family protein [Rhodococcus yunnanensis]MDV6264930.1 nuclear transport factor 2 family protein [Rhodococcus yunnanensis]